MIDNLSDRLSYLMVWLLTYGMLRPKLFFSYCIDPNLFFSEESSMDGELNNI